MKEKKIKLCLAIIGIFSCFLLYQVIVAARSVGNYQEKIWLHRCNSLEKLHEKAHLYPNIEVDVVFREKENTLDVTHDLDTTFHLNIEDYFKILLQKDGRMWLDIKNLSASNRKSIFQELTRLCYTYEVSKERLIVESPAWRELELFTDNGFYTSMYVPYDKPSRLTETETDSCMQELLHVAETGCVKALSFPYWWYPEIKENLNSNIDLLTWKHRTTQFMFLLSHDGKKMLEDKQLKVVLIKDKGEYHR